MTVRPKKHLGQHFLIDKNIAQKIVSLVSAPADADVVEIGPGRGVLTQYLLTRHKHLHIVEVDDEAVDYVRETFADLHPNVIHCDFLKWRMEQEIRPDAYFIGNLPYNISSPIFFKFLENVRFVREAVCMIQKEVAVRIAADKGNKDYGILSVLLGYYFEIRYEFTVPPTVFAPPPKVMSAVISLHRREHVEEIDFQALKTVVKVGFNQRRKTLRNALKALTFADFPEKDRFMELRAEQLSIADFVLLAKAWKKEKGVEIEEEPWIL